MSKSTTKYGLTYAEGTDVPDIAYWTKALADSTEAALTAKKVDLGSWTILALASGVTVYTTGTDARLIVRNGWAHLVGEVKVSPDGALTSGGGVTLLAAPLPAEARPAYRIAPQQASSGNNHWALVVTAAGVVSAERYGPSAHTAAAWLPFSASWPVA